MRIRVEQVNGFEREAWRRFELEMLQHCQAFSPRLAEELGEAQLLASLRAATVRAWNYGFTNRGPIRLFLELTLLCGSGFDTDPQYPFAENALRSAGDQMARAEALHCQHNAYLRGVKGPDGAFERVALQELAVFVQKPLPFGTMDLKDGVYSVLCRLFPQKTRYGGQAGITKVIEEGARVAAMHGLFEVRQITLIVALLLIFGHACTNDPLFPWIGSTLQDESIPSAGERADVLERMALSRLVQATALQLVGA